MIVDSLFKFLVPNFSFTKELPRFIGASVELSHKLHAKINLVFLMLIILFEKSTSLGIFVLRLLDISLLKQFG